MKADSHQPDHSSASCSKVVAAQLAALAHPARIGILRHLAGRDASCCKDVVAQLDLAQSTVSQHLKVLVDAGLVRLTPDRQRSRYEIDRAALTVLSGTINELLYACCAEPAGRD